MKLSLSRLGADDGTSAAATSVDATWPPGIAMHGASTASELAESSGDVTKALPCAVLVAAAVEYTFIQNRFHPLTLSSKHDFHPMTLSSTHDFIQ